MMVKMETVLAGRYGEVDKAKRRLQKAGFLPEEMSVQEQGRRWWSLAVAADRVMDASRVLGLVREE
jgi:hypothetical protein